MKKIELTMLLLSTLAIAVANNYKILKINDSNIIINGAKARIGDEFDDHATIKWSQDFQAMKVLDLTTNRRYLMVAKPTEKREEKIIDIISRIGHLSTHGDGNELSSPFDKMENDIYEQYDLLDTIDISTDLVINEKSYFQGAYQYGDTYLKKKLKHDGRNIIIDKSIFVVDGKELEPRDIELSIDYINGNTGQAIFIKDGIKITIIPDLLE